MTPEQQAKRVEALARELAVRDGWRWPAGSIMLTKRAAEFLEVADRVVPVVSESDYDLAIIAVGNANARAERAEEAARAFADELRTILTAAAIYDDPRDVKRMSDVLAAHPGFEPTPGVS